MLLQASANASLKITSKSFIAVIDPKKNNREYSTVLRTDRKAETPVSEAQLIVTGEGEYEQQDMFIFAIPAFRGDDKLAFVFEQDGRKVLYLPGIEGELAEQVVSEAGGIDVLIIHLPPKAEAKDIKSITEKLDPRLLLVINASEETLKKAGLPPESTISELDTEKASYPEEKMSVVALG